MFRKRRQPAPFFRMPGQPFNPATGENALLGAYPHGGTTLALFQVIGDDPNDPETADTHDNYVVCRGYEADHDPYFRYLHDPYTKEDTTPINVAKPYSLRGTFPYSSGQVIVAARIKHRLGYNPGKAETTVGQPADLDEEVVLLMDDDDVGISWLDVGTPEPSVVCRSILNVDDSSDPAFLELEGWGPTWLTNSPPTGAMPSVTLSAQDGWIKTVTTDRYAITVEGVTIMNPYPWPVTLRNASLGRRYWVEKANSGNNWIIVSPYADTFRTTFHCTGINSPSGLLKWALDADLYNIGAFTVEDTPSGVPASYITWHGFAGLRCRVDLYIEQSYNSSGSNNATLTAGESASSKQVSTFSSTQTGPTTVTHHYHGERHWDPGDENHFWLSPVSPITIGESELIITPLGFQTG